MHQFAGLFRVFSLMFSDPCKISNQNLQTYLHCLLETVLVAATCSAFFFYYFYFFFCGNQWNTFPPLQYGNLVVGVPHVILIVQDEEKIGNLPCLFKNMCLCRTVGGKKTV
jgi:hypothetical protein